MVFIDTCKRELRGQGQFQITHMLLKFALCSCHYSLYVEAFPPGNGILDIYKNHMMHFLEAVSSGTEKTFWLSCLPVGQAQAMPLF